METEKVSSNKKNTVFGNHRLSNKGSFHGLSEDKTQMIHFHKIIISFRKHFICFITQPIFRKICGEIITKLFLCCCIFDYTRSLKVNLLNSCHSVIIIKMELKYILATEMKVYVRFSARKQ